MVRSIVRRCLAAVFEPENQLVGHGDGERGADQERG